jgi:RHS repeat-associated protein
MGSVDFRYQYSGHRLSTIQQGTDPTPLFHYNHNARGQVTSRHFEDSDYSLSWDSAHRRTGDLMFERSSGGGTTKYARLGGHLTSEIRDGGRLAIHTDVIGSVRQKTNAMGTVVDEDVRAPYGSKLLNGYYRNGPAFTGHMEDGGTGLTYMKARYYDPVAMRFLSPDSVYVDLTTGGNFNRYWYANNNPHTFVDPDGRNAIGTRINRQAARDQRLRSFRETNSFVSVEQARQSVAHDGQKILEIFTPWGEIRDTSKAIASGDWKSAIVAVILSRVGGSKTSDAAGGSYQIPR